MPHLQQFEKSASACENSALFTVQRYNKARYIVYHCISV